MNASIDVKVRLFAGAAQAIGKPEVVVRVSADQPGDAISVRQVAEQLREQFPELAEWIDRSRWAASGQFVELDALLESGDVGQQTIALIPPVSGG
jgi:sulfur-carrier protein